MSPTDSSTARPVSVADIVPLLDRLLPRSVDASTIAASTEISALGLDSLQTFELVVMIEEMVGLDRSPSDLPPVETVGDLVAYWRDLGDGNASAAVPRTTQEDAVTGPRRDIEEGAGTSAERDGAPSFVDRPPIGTTDHASLGGARVRIRPLSPADYEMAVNLEISTRMLTWGRFRGAVPSPDAVIQSLWAGANAVFAIDSLEKRQSIGTVTIYDVDSRDGHAKLAFSAVPDSALSVLVFEGIALGIDYAFQQWPLLKLYAEVFSPNLATYRSALEYLFKEEGRLRGHTFFDGARYDVHILALYRDDWVAVRDRLPYSS